MRAMPQETGKPSKFNSRPKPRIMEYLPDFIVFLFILPISVLFFLAGSVFPDQRGPLSGIGVLGFGILAALIWRNYSKALKSWLENEFRSEEEYSARLKQYKIAASKYTEEKERYDHDRSKWERNRDSQIAEFTEQHQKARSLLYALYNSERIVPAPYRYAEAVCYLYDFMSTSSDEYTIMYALERLDHAEIKEMMQAVIYNQSAQILLQTQQLAATEQLHYDSSRLDNITIR